MIASLPLKSSATPIGFPYLTGREAHELLLYRPHFRKPEKAAKPANVAEAEEISPLLNPVAADPDDFALDVETPLGEVLSPIRRCCNSSTESLVTAIH